MTPIAVRQAIRQATARLGLSTQQWPEHGPESVGQFVVAPIVERTFRHRPSPPAFPEPVAAFRPAGPSLTMTGDVVCRPARQGCRPLSNRALHPVPKGVSIPSLIRPRIKG